MNELRNEELIFSFPEVHSQARLRVSFQRTLRFPDDGNEYLLPLGLDSFPLRQVDDLGRPIPAQWREHGGVMLPMYQSEALWLNFDSDYLAQPGATGRYAAVLVARTDGKVRFTER